MKRGVYILAGLLLSLNGRADTLPQSAEGTAWWTAFGHAGLAAVVEQGLAANPDPVEAANLLRAARQEVRSAAAGARPQAGLQAGYRWGREKSMMTGGIEDDIDPLAASARFSWDIDLFGRVASEVESARARVGLFEADAEGVRLALALEIAGTYIELAYRDEQIAQLTAYVADAASLLSRAENRREAGLDNPVAVEKVRAMEQEAEHMLMQADIERTQQEARLRELLGGEEPAVKPGPLSSFTLPPAPDLSNPDLHLGRPDVVRAHQTWLAARGQASAASRARLPSLSLVVSAAGEGKDAGDPEQWEAWAGPVLSVPLWQPERGTDAAASWARAAAAESAFMSASLRAVREIEAAREERNQTGAMTAHMEARYRAMLASAESAARQRQAGLIQDAALREARMKMQEAAVTAARWQANALRSQLDLIGAIGGDGPGPAAEESRDLP